MVSAAARKPSGARHLFGCALEVLLIDWAQAL
jgi:hypothetical protein